MISVMVITVKRVTDDQVMIVNRIFPVMDAKKVKLQATSKPQDQPDKEASEADLTSSIFYTLGGTDYLSSMMSPAEILNESLLFNSKTNTIFEKDDFRTLSCSSFFQSVLPQ